MAVVRVTPERGKPPNQWTVRKYADVGTSEEFVRQLLELHDILKGSTIHDPEREKVNDALGGIQLDGLLPAFLELEKIRKSVGKELPLLDQMQPYEDLARKLWRTYKELMQSAAKLMGFDIGFLFTNDVNFDTGLKRFRGLNPRVPDAFESFLRQTRKTWQNDLAKFRNEILEHPSADKGLYKAFYDPASAEALFEYVWRTIVEILGFLLLLKLPPHFGLIDHGSNDPNRKPWPNRFQFTLIGVTLPPAQQ